MDNNNNFGQPMGQPMPNQPQPMPTQPYQQPYQQPYPPQPMMKPPRQPMDPVKKKKLILGFSIGGAILVLGIAAAIIVPVLLRVDYAPAYNIAKELKPKIYDIYHSYDCEYVVDYVDSTYTNIKDYTEYIDGCKSVYDSGVDELISELENTAAAKQNSDISNQFAKFKSEYSALSSGNNEELANKLDLWQAQHNYLYSVDGLNYGSSSDAEFTTAANYLINSGNDTLKTYGEGWLEHALAIAAAYRAWSNASCINGNKSQLYDEYNNKRSEFADWRAANKPDINTIAPLNFSDTSKMYNEFTKLYDLISTTYQKNYNSGSGDCTEAFGEVYCE